MKVLLMQGKWQFPLAFLDDIVIFPSTLDEHIDHVRQILTLLKDTGVSLNIKIPNDLEVEWNISVISCALAGLKLRLERLIRTGTGTINYFDRTPIFFKTVHCFFTLCSDFSRVSASLN